MMMLLDLEKIKKNKISPKDMKMISSLRKWADDIENGELKTLRDYEIQCTNKSLDINFKIGVD